MARQFDEDALEFGLRYRLDQIARTIVMPVVRLRHAGNDQHRHALMTLVATQFPVHLPTTDVRQQDVKDHCGKVLAPQGFQPLLAGAADQAGKAVALPDLRHYRCEIGIVLDDQQPRTTPTALRLARQQRLR